VTSAGGKPVEPDDPASAGKGAVKYETVCSLFSGVTPGFEVLQQRNSGN